ncbi:Rpn family recombination-promoting nuclease/putative transposase [Propionivibrio sp.]|uniref:Rpn family recombination-promoting nuclease/putative transposase n=1 Tax=Propionivibrio sp. TaxID=2212460 RepID=UPI003BF2F7CE
MTHLHDTGYKFLFSRADLVRELLEVFSPPGITELLDYATLRPETGNFITPAMRKREDDVVWSIKLQGQRIYLYLLLEFQSSIDKGMPVRMMQYVAALYDHLVRSKAIDLADGLPPVLPIVIYNGDARWNHSPEVFDLIQPHPAVLTEFQPKLKFWLLDEGRFSVEHLEGLHRVMAAIFRMEHARDTEEVKRAIRYLGQSVAQSPYKQTIDKAVMQWMGYRLSRKMPDLLIPDVDDLLKGTEMLETNLDRIRANAIAEGVLLGKFEAEALVLQRLLNKRFGPLPAEVAAQISAAGPEQIEAWLDLVLDAADLAAIFPPKQH